MNVTVSALDDDDVQLKALELHVAEFNKSSSNKIILDTFTDYALFLENFNHDLALIDVVLGDMNVDGFDVAKQLLKEKENATVIMMSSGFSDRLTLVESLIPKRGMRISEIMSRFLSLKNNKTRNILQIFMKDAEIDGWTKGRGCFAI